MKILIVTDFSSSKPGGAQLMAETVSKVLTAAGNTCKLATYSSSPPLFFSKVRDLNLVREARSLINPYGIAKMLALQLYFKPDVIWYHNINNQWSWASLLFNIRRSKRLITLHDLTVISNRKLNTSEVDKIVKSSALKYHKLRARLTKALIGSMVTVAIGEICKDVLTKMNFRIDAQISNRVAPCKHRSPKLRLSKTVLFAGRSYLKGVDLVAKAVALEEKWMLLIASDEEAYRLALEFCPAEQIKYLGLISREELLELLHSVELVAVCSQYLDNYPTIGLEALVHGSIPFTTSCTGLAKVIGTISSHLILEPGKIPDLEDILHAGKAARYHLLDAASSVSDIDAMIRDYLALIEN